MLCAKCRTVYCVTLHDVQLQVTFGRGEIRTSNTIIVF